MLDYPFPVVIAIVSIAAFAVAAAVLWLLLRAPVGARLVAQPSDARWHAQPTPTFGGVGIFAGFVAGVAVGARSGRRRVERRARRDPRGRHDRLRCRAHRRPLAPEPDRQARGSDHGSGGRPGQRPERRDRRQRRTRVGDRAALAGRDHERVQPAGQHGRPGGDARRRLVRLLRDRRADRARERHRPGPRPRARPCVRRLPPVQPQATAGRRSLHGRLRQPW